MILVLPKDEQILQAIRDTATALGWSAEVSQGEEQVVLVLAGAGDMSELAEALPHRDAIDLVPLLAGRDYWRRRSRRRFLNWLAYGLGLLTMVGVLIPVTGFLTPPKEALVDPNLVKVATVDQLPLNSARRVRIQGRPILLVHAGSERYFALGARCTYMDDCQLEWDPELQQIVCPCHGCVFDLYGNIVKGPPSVPLARYRVRRLGDNIYIDREG